MMSLTDEEGRWGDCWDRDYCSKCGATFDRGLENGTNTVIVNGIAYSVCVKCQEIPVMTIGGRQ